MKKRKSEPPARHTAATVLMWRLVRHAVARCRRPIGGVMWLDAHGRPADYRPLNASTLPGAWPLRQRPQQLAPVSWQTPSGPSEEKKTV